MGMILTRSLGSTMRRRERVRVAHARELDSDLALCISLRSCRHRRKLCMKLRLGGRWARELGFKLAVHSIVMSNKP